MTRSEVELLQVIMADILRELKVCQGTVLFRDGPDARSAYWKESGGFFINTKQAGVLRALQSHRAPHFSNVQRIWGTALALFVNLVDSKPGILDHVTKVGGKIGEIDRVFSIVRSQHGLKHPG